MTGITLIVIIVAISMFIAYVGDITGKKIGKKRISWFGLRPRATAMLITIIFGGLISVLTFGLLILSSSQMRQMLLDTEKMQKQRSELQAEVKNLNSKVQMLSDNIMTATSQRDKLKEESDGYRDDAVLLSDEIGNKQFELDELTKNKDDLENIITELEDHAITSEEKLTATSAELKKLKDEYNKTNTEIKLMNSEITRLQTEKPAFIEGSRIYGFTLKNDLLISQVTDAIHQSFEDFERNDFETTKGCTIQQPSSETLYYDVIEKLSASSADKSIILVFAAENCFPGDEIPVEFQVFDQYIVFSKGALITEQTVDKKLGLFEASGLAAKLVHDAAGKALDRGLLPDPVAKVMTFTPKAYNDIAEQIVKHHRPMKIQLFALKDIYRGVYLDETNLRFNIIDAD